MITVGLVQEIGFISKYLGTPLYLKLASEITSGILDIVFKDGYLELYFKQNKIWREKILFEESMFGIESCTEIARIISLIEKNDISWKEHCYFED